jgi:hypothetical protein
VPPVFEVLPSDGDIAATLRRWARANGYELAWNVTWTAPITGRARIDAPSFVDAVDRSSPDCARRAIRYARRQGGDRVVRFSAPPGRSP